MANNAMLHTLISKNYFGSFTMIRCLANFLNVRWGREMTHLYNKAQ